jgi:chemotaxis methyl-accepting protein methylase
MAEDREGLQHIIEKVYRERGFDFRGYRETTLIRRLARRLQRRDVRTYSDYACILDQDPGEYDQLFDDLTINVTSFFRDEVAFRALEDSVLPAIINSASDPCRVLRIWSAGCATGEEPYSIAMLVLERLGQDANSWEITILATDINATALQYARAGIFTPKSVEGISATWRDRYFVSENNGFCIKPVLKQLVTFQVHNLLNDAPYHDLNLVVCRNVFIYFDPTLQTRALQNFHQGLQDGGFLFLGKAEVLVGETKKLFHCVDSKAKVFQKSRMGNAE